MLTTDQNQPLDVVETSALEQMERASIDIQISTAKKYPRELSTVKKAMLSFATLDEETAAGCFYTLPARKQGDKPIQGPSVRMAEIAISTYKNLRAGSRVIADDGRFITAQGVCHDLENNVCITVENKRRVTTKDGRRYGDDMVAMTGNAACSIALRNAVFRVVPLALVKPIYEAAKRVALGDAKTLVTRRADALAHFTKMGVKQDRVFATLEVKGLDDIGLEQVGILIGLANAIRDGEATVDESFPEPKKNLAETLKGAPASEPAKVPAPTASPATAAAPVPAPEVAATPAGTVPAGDEVFARDEVVDKLKGLMLDLEVSESKLFEYARRLKEVPEGVDELFALPTATLAKLQLAVSACSTKAARKASAR